MLLFPRLCGSLGEALRGGVPTPALASVYADTPGQANRFLAMKRCRRPRTRVAAEQENLNWEQEHRDVASPPRFTEPAAVGTVGGAVARGAPAAPPPVRAKSFAQEEME